MSIYIYLHNYGNCTCELFRGVLFSKSNLERNCSSYKINKKIKRK